MPLRDSVLSVLYTFHFQNGTLIAPRVPRIVSVRTYGEKRFAVLYGLLVCLSNGRGGRGGTGKGKMARRTAPGDPTPLVAPPAGGLPVCCE